VVRTTDGAAHTVEVPYPPGLSRGRLDEATVIKKFQELTAPHIDQARRDRIVDEALTFDKSPSCMGLMRAVAAPAA
jgi:2-methylcitrate dehydratase PrpD